MPRSDSKRHRILKGELPATHPVQHLMLQLWAGWRQVESGLSADGKPPGLDQFASAVGTSVRRAARVLRGNYADNRMPYGSIETWTRNLQSHWESRGLDLDVWIVRRPDGRYSVTIKKRIQRP